MKHRTVRVAIRDGTGLTPLRFDAGVMRRIQDALTLVISADDRTRAQGLMLRLLDSEVIEVQDGDVHVARVVPDSFRLGAYTVEDPNGYAVAFEVRLIAPDALDDV